MYTILDANYNPCLFQVTQVCFLDEKNFKIFKSTKVEKSQVDDFFGEDSADFLKAEIAKFANKEYSVEELKFDILGYANTFSNIKRLDFKHLKLIGEDIGIKTKLKSERVTFKVYFDSYEEIFYCVAEEEKKVLRFRLKKPFKEIKEEYKEELLTYRLGTNFPEEEEATPYDVFMTFTEIEQF